MKKSDDPWTVTPIAYGATLRSALIAECARGITFHHPTGGSPRLLVPDRQALFRLPPRFERHRRVEGAVDVERAESDTDRMRALAIPGADVDHLPAPQLQP